MLIIRLMRWYAIHIVIAGYIIALSATLDQHIYDSLSHAFGQRDIALRFGRCGPVAYA